MSASPTSDPPDLEALAREHGLAPLGLRPRLGDYIQQLWARRSFVWRLALAKASSRYQNSYLGQAWLILNPLLLAGVYYIVFGVLLDTSRGVENFIGFLVIGIFIYVFIGSTMTSSGEAILGNLPLIRALQFPRAILPLQVVLTETIVLLPALGVMMGIVVASGEVPQWTWLLLPLALLVTVVFNAGVAFLAARIVQGTRDLKNVLPLVVRLMRYVSGVFFSISAYTANLSFGWVLEYQPIAVYLTLFRGVMMEEFPLSTLIWGVGGVWAVLFFVVGLIVFWRAEDRYGRD